MKNSPYLNSDGSFIGGFDGCVLHMTEHEGHSEDSAKRICGHIAQDVASKDSRISDAHIVQIQTVLKAINPMFERAQSAELAARHAAARHEELECRMSVAAPSEAVGEFMFMPAGTHDIYPRKNGKPVTAAIRVLIDPASAEAINEQLHDLTASSPHPPYFDFNHDDSEASFWPSAFLWRDQPQPGVYTQGEWSSKGKEAIEGKIYRAFSPRFSVDDVRARPARVVANPNATLNFGGLVNSPAFRAILPIAAKHAGATSVNQNPR